jgi:hypothetical protein
MKLILGTSKTFQVDLNDAIVLLKNASLVGLAAAITFVGENLANVNFGAATAFVVPVVTIVLQAATRWLSDYTKK